MTIVKDDEFNGRSQQHTYTDPKDKSRFSEHSVKQNIQSMNTRNEETAWSGHVVIFNMP